MDVECAEGGVSMYMCGTQGEREISTDQKGKVILGHTWVDEGEEGRVGIGSWWEMGDRVWSRGLICLLSEKELTVP